MGNIICSFSSKDVNTVRDARMYHSATQVDLRYQERFAYEKDACLEMDEEIFLKQASFLIMFGHDSEKIWDYGYHFAKVSLKAIIDMKKQISIAIVEGIGLSFSRDRNAIRNFLKE